MIAYNKQSLDNLELQDQLEDAFNKNFISVQELNLCKEKYPSKLYSPNPFVRIGLFILTLIITFCSFGLLALMVQLSSENGISGMLIFSGIISYIMLEIMIKANHHYKSGVDDALMWASIIFIVTSLNITGSFSALMNAVVLFALSIYFAIRFANMAISAVACISFLAVIFFTYIKLGTFAKATVPFLLMGISLLIYLVSSKKTFQENRKYYAKCWLMAEVISLVSIYTCGNYFVVRELSNSMFNLNLQEGQSIPFGWLFWVFTIVVPLVYFITGISKKNMVLIRTGLILIAAIVFTIRYYYLLLPAEIAMALGGALLIIIAYTLIRYLKKPKHGFSDILINKKSFASKQLESLIIVQTFGQAKTNTGNATEFGGGTGGGGGAGGEF